MTINIYTDGAHSSATNVGGWAIIVTQNDQHIGQISDYEYDTTNNRMELKAILEALKLTRQGLSELSETISIHTDSAYISNCFAQGWYKLWRNNGWKTAKRTAVANQDLWEEILSWYEATPNVQICKVSGHSGNSFNELADQLAVSARIRGAEERKKNEQEKC